MKLRNIVIAIGAASAAGLYLLKDNKGLVVVSTSVVIGAGLMNFLRDKNDQNKKIRDYEYFFNRAQDNSNLQNIKRQYSTTIKQ